MAASPPPLAALVGRRRRKDLAGQTDGELADALEDYAAVIRTGDDADALLPASDEVRTQCLLAAADAG